MEINIQSVGFSASAQLQEFVESKLSKLLRFDDDIASADVYLKLENAQEERKVAEIKLHMRGNELFATKTGDSFEEAVDGCIEALRRQVRKRKGKLRD